MTLAFPVERVESRRLPFRASRLGQHVGAFDRCSRRMPSTGRHTSPTAWTGLRDSLLLTKAPKRTSRAVPFYGICRQKREPTSGLKNRLPLLQLRVIIGVLQGLARDCKCPISKGL